MEGAEQRRRFLDRMTLSLIPSHGRIALDYEKAMRERNRLLKEQILDTRWMAALETQMAKLGAQITQNRMKALRLIKDAQEQSLGEFPRADLLISSPHDSHPLTTENDLMDGFAAHREQDFRAGRTLLGPHRDDLQAFYSAKGMAAQFCSTGEQKALLISLILANARAVLKNGSPVICLLDEIAAHLDEARRASLYMELSEIGCQSFMTGTEKELFHTLPQCNLKFHVSDKGGASSVG